MTAPAQGAVDRARLIEPDLKRVLYGCLERAQARKASLYLSDGAQRPTMHLVTRYGWRDAPRPAIDATDPVVRRLGRGTPVIFNKEDAAIDIEMAEVLFRNETESMLVAPVAGNGRQLVGVIALCDKAGQTRFNAADADAATTIAREIARVLAANGLYSIQAAPVEAPRTHDAIAAAVSGAQTLPGGLSERAQNAIRIARERLQRRSVTAEARRMIVTSAELRDASIFLPAALAIPGVTAAALTAADRGAQLIVAPRAPIPADALDALSAAIRDAIAFEDFAPPKPVLMPPAQATGEIGPDDVARNVTLQVASRIVTGVFFTATFRGEPSDAVRAQLTAFATRLGDTIAAMCGRGDAAVMRQRAALRVLEPDFERHPSLSAHSALTSGIAQRFAQTLAMDDETVEMIRVAALVHDAGLRLLDYRDYIDQVDFEFERDAWLEQHPVVGAALVEPLLGSDVAEVVLHHHEQYDGRGYPRGLAGARIPIGARVLAVADAWAGFTSPWSKKRATLEFDDAVARMKAASGNRLDGALTDRFLARLGDIA